MRKTLKIFAVIAGILMLMTLGLFLMAGGQIVALRYEDFSKSELEKLRMPEGWALPAELTFSGPSQVEAHSHWTWWAMKLFAGTFLADAKAGGRRLTLVVDTGAALTVLSPSAAVAAQATLVTEGPEVVHWQIPT